MRSPWHSAPLTRAECLPSSVEAHPPQAPVFLTPKGPGGQARRGCSCCRLGAKGQPMSTDLTTLLVAAVCNPLLFERFLNIALPLLTARMNACRLTPLLTREDLDEITNDTCY